jgi:hypothetical protein
MIPSVAGGPAGWRDAVTTAAIAALALVAQIPILDRSVVWVDEGQLVAIADRLRHGDVLYRDVYTGIFPGIYYLTALLLDVFGEDVVVTRWAQAVVNAFTAVCLWRIGLRAMQPAWAAVAPLLYLVLVAVDFPGLSMFNYSPLALLFGLGALLFLLRQLESARTADGVAVGVLLGACGLVKQNFGALAVAAVTIAFAWGRKGAPLGRRSFVTGLLPVLASGAVLALAAAAGLAAAGAFPEFLRVTAGTLWESQLDLGAFSYPIPPIFGPHPSDDGTFVFVYTPAAFFNYLMRGEQIFGLSMSPLVLGAAIRLAYGGALATLLAGAALLWLERRAGTPERRGATRAVVVFAGLLFLGIFPSAVWSHLAFVLPPVLLVLGVVGDRVWNALARRRATAARAWATAWAVVLLVGLAVGAQIARDLGRWYSVPLGLARASLHVAPAQRRLLVGGTRFIERCAAPEDPVFVAPDLPILYFVTDRRNPTPYDLVIPGDVDEARIVERLGATGTRCVVYNPKMFLKFAPFDELFPEVARLLDSEYRRVVVIEGEGQEWYGLARRRKPWR